MIYPKTISNSRSFVMALLLLLSGMLTQDSFAETSATLQAKQMTYNQMFNHLFHLKKWYELESKALKKDASWFANKGWSEDEQESLRLAQQLEGDLKLKVSPLLREFQRSGVEKSGRNGRLSKAIRTRLKAWFIQEIPALEYSGLESEDENGSEKSSIVWRALKGLTVFLAVQSSFGFWLDSGASLPEAPSGAGAGCGGGMCSLH